MKNIFKSSLLLLCSVALFSACADDNDSNPVLGKPTTFVLNTPAYSTVPVDLATSTEIPFSWSSPDYGFPVEAEFQLEASIDGNFTISVEQADADESGATIPNYVVLPTIFTGGHGSIPCNTLADALNKMGNWPEGEAPATQTLVVRAAAKTKNPGATPIYSNTVNIIVVPNLQAAPSNYPEFIYEIGNESGWSTAHPLFCENQDGIYKGFYWLDGEFKFKPNENNWDNDWEYDSEGKIADNGGDNMPGVDAGFYLITVDVNELTYSVEPITISIIGGFNDWAGDVEMTYNVEGGYWEVTTSEVEGEYKFRANHDWAINWGGSEDDLTLDGANLNSNGGSHTYKLYISYAGNHKVVIE